ATASVMSFFITAFPWWPAAQARLATAIVPPVAARPFFPTSRATSWRRIGGLISLFSLAGLHAYVVLSLACFRGIIFRTRLLLLPTLLAGRLFSSCCSGDAAKTEHHNDNRSDRSHDDLLSMLGNRSLCNSLKAH